MTEKRVGSNPSPDAGPSPVKFVELKAFAKAWKRIGFSEDDRRALEAEILSNLDAPIIKGTGGLRKLRFAVKHKGGGKSGGSRVCFAYYTKWTVVILVSVYVKNEKDDLSQGERNAIKGILGEIEKALEEGGLNV